MESGSQFRQSTEEEWFGTNATITGPDEDKAWEIFLQYEEAGFSYTDCSSFAVMERLRIDTAFTFDMHFKTMKHAIVPEL